MSKVICYYDFEATSVSCDSDPISLGIIAVQNNKILKSIYCEFTDFNIDKCDDWVKENIVGKLHLKERFEGWDRDKNVPLFEHFKNKSYFNIKAETNAVIRYLKDWLSQFEFIEFWADFDVIDKPMLIDLIADWNYNKLEENDETCDIYIMPEFRRKTFNHKIGLPKHLPNIKYDQFFDLHTLFKIKNINTDINREEFIGDLIKQIPEGNKHNALYDCYVAWKCYDKLMSI